MKSFVFLIVLAIVGAAHAKFPNVCNLCEKLIGDAENAENYDASWLKMRVEQICAQFGLLKEVCMDQFKKMSALADKLIRSGEPPKKACQTLHLCQ